jgi:hypothetical protein
VARKNKKGRLGRHTKKSNPRLTSVKRRFTFLVPVHLRIQYTFDETEVENLDNDRSPPDITEAAAEALGQELREYLGQQYYIESIEALDDGLDTVFLGESEE